MESVVLEIDILFLQQVISLHEEVQEQCFR